MFREVDGVLCVQHTIKTKLCAYNWCTASILRSFFMKLLYLYAVKIITIIIISLNI